MGIKQFLRSTGRAARETSSAGLRTSGYLILRINCGLPMLRTLLVCTSLIACLACFASASMAVGPPDTVEVAGAPVVDHHVHIRSSAATDVFSQLMETLEGRTPGNLQQHTGAADVLSRLDAAGIEQAAVLSVAYFFGAPDIDVEDERARVRQENAYVGAQAAQAPERLAAFCSLNPLAAYALEEVERCGGDDRIVGLKLHLANSDVDLRDPADVEVLRNVIQTANAQQLALVIHLYTRHPSFGYKDAETFIAEVLPEASDVPVQIAHLAGPGPYREATAQASQAFIDAMETEALSNVYFDLAEVLIDPTRAEGDEELRERIQQQNEAVAVRIEALGVERVLYGSDWIIAYDPPRYVDAVRGLPLPEEVRATIYANRAPYLP